MNAAMRVLCCASMRIINAAGVPGEITNSKMPIFAAAIGTMAGRKRGGIMPVIFAALIFQRPPTAALG